MSPEPANSQLLRKAQVTRPSRRMSVTDNVLTVAEGIVYLDGHIEQVPGAVLTYDPAKTSGADYVYVELLKYNYGYNQDAALINPATGEPTAEREKWVLTLKDHDTSGETLPNNVIERKVVPIYKFDRETGDVTATILSSGDKSRILSLSERDKSECTTWSRSSRAERRP